MLILGVHSYDEKAEAFIAEDRDGNRYRIDTLLLDRFMEAPLRPLRLWKQFVGSKFAVDWHDDDFAGGPWVGLIAPNTGEFFQCWAECIETGKKPGPTYVYPSLKAFEAGAPEGRILEA